MSEETCERRGEGVGGRRWPEKPSVSASGLGASIDDLLRECGRGAWNANEEGGAASALL